MLELFRSQATPYFASRAPRYEPAWDDLDDAHGAVWEAIKHLFPENAMVDQTDYGCLVVSWALGGRGHRASHFAQPVIIRIAPGLLVALWACDEEGRRDIANLQADPVGEALETYDPHSRVPSCGVIELGE